MPIIQIRAKEGSQAVLYEKIIYKYSLFSDMLGASLPLPTLLCLHLYLPQSLRIASKSSRGHLMQILLEKLFL